MKAPLTWIKEYTKINLPLASLMWKLTEIGLTAETFEKIEGDTVLDIEVTPNRPDWLSIIGIAREVAVSSGTKINLPAIPPIPKKTKDLPLQVKIGSELVGRYTGITMGGVTVKSSPEWMQRRLKMMGLRPINNLVDITNYVMYEFGIPIHVFDYDKFKTHKLNISKSKGGEKFVSVDGTSYNLPPDALIIKDSDRVIDLCGIKGGENTGIWGKTKNIYIHVPVYSPQIIRKASHALKLASDASYIYERGPDLGGTLNTLNRVVDLTLQLAGGQIASDVIDIKSKDYVQQTVSLPLSMIKKILGNEISTKDAVEILTKLNLSPKTGKDSIECLIPTYRSDLKIPVDLIEEIARIWGYNKFKKTLPTGELKKEKIAYYFDPSPHLKLKYLLAGIGFNEIQTLSLSSKAFIQKAQLVAGSHIKIANPVSAEFEYLRTSIIPSLIEAVAINTNDSVKLFELNKVYFEPVDDARESYKLAGVETGTDFRNFKGRVEYILDGLNITDYGIKPYSITNALWHPTKSGVIEKGDNLIGTFGAIHPNVLKSFSVKHTLWAFELDVETLQKLSKETEYSGINQYPPQIEDVTLSIPAEVLIGDVVKVIKQSSRQIVDIELNDIFQNYYTFRIYYQDPTKTLDNSEVDKVRTDFIKKLKGYNVNLKD